MSVGEWAGSLGALTARLRVTAGLTQEQLAERAGVSVRAISSIECGIRHPRRSTVERLAIALGLPAGERAALLELAARQRQPVRARPPRSAGVPLAGRRSELAAIAELISRSGPGLLAFAGEPGIGKSRLLAEAADLADAHGIPVLAGVCRRGGDPYAPIVDALADHLDRRDGSTPRAAGTGLELLLPELSPGGPVAPPAQHRRLAFAAVNRYLCDVAGSGRVLLVLDDLHWAGPDTADLLTHLLRTVDGQAGPIRVVMASRTGEVPSGSRLAAAVADLARINQVRRVRLDPLAPPDAESLVTAAAGDRPLTTARRARILRRAGGLPLFLVELTEAALDGSAEEVPGNLRLAIAHQVAALPEPARLALRRMAAIGAVVPIERLIDRLAGMAADGVVDALETSCRYGILAETRTGYRFRFPLIHELLVAGLGPNRRRLWRSA